MSKSAEWFETFFDGLYGQALGSEALEGRAAEDAKTVRRLLKLRKGRCVLDVPCGMGRLTLPLARMGLVVTGVDLTAPYVRRARRRAKAEGLDIRFIRADMRDLPFEAEFDAAFNWFSSFGYFDDAGNLGAARGGVAAPQTRGRWRVGGVKKYPHRPR